MSKILRLPAVLKLVGFSRSQIYTLARRGAFPAPLRLSQNASGWLESDIRGWLDQRIAERDAAGAKRA